jgi:hypothetical protein
VNSAGLDSRLPYLESEFCRKLTEQVKGGHLWKLSSATGSIKIIDWWETAIRGNLDRNDLS